MKNEKVKTNMGFTLIELLVVIGIIGILAAGILAAIDPLEQLKKGRDSSKRSVCVEVFNALTRYYAVNGAFPWTSASYGKTLSAASADTISSLVDRGELKPEFMKGLPAGANTAITINQTSTTAPIYVCFDPDSKSVSREPTTIYSGTNGLTGCEPTAGLTCYWCAR